MKRDAAAHTTVSLLRVAVALALIAACANNQLNGLTPLLKIQEGTPTDSSGRYLIDFGAVGIGTTSHQSITVLDAGRAPLTLQPATVSAPFSPDLTTTALIAASTHDAVSFGFSPTRLGPAQEIVTLNSNGGSATIVLSGTGVQQVCVYAITPTAIDFGTGVVGQTLAAAVQFDNLGSVDCTISAIQISPSSDPSFSLSPGQPLSGTATPTGGSFPVSVSFTPAVASAALSGKLTFQVGPQNTTVTVPLSAAATPSPCVLVTQPAQVVFPPLVIGQTNTQTVLVEATTSTPCTLADIQIESGSDPSYTLGAGQATSGEAVEGTPFPIAVTFAPSSAGVTLLGRILFHSGPPDTIVEVQLEGAATPCKFHLEPAQLNFGSTAPGHTSTLAVQVVNDGPVQCSVSGIQMDPAGNSAFTVTAGQVLTGTSTMGTPFAISVSFSPTADGPPLSSNLFLNVGPPTTAVQVPVKGIPATCPDPNMDGSCPIATLPIYIESDTQLFSFDPMTDEATLLSTFDNGVSEAVDIGIDTAGNLLVLNITGFTPTLYAVNPTTGVCTMLAAVADSGAVGLTFLSDGSPVIAGNGVEILDPRTFEVTQTLVQPGQFVTSGDVVGLPDGSLYWSVVGAANDRLIKVDPATGATTDIGDLGAQGVFGLSYANGVLFGFTGGGQFLKIDPATAVSTIGDVPGNWHGATTNPVTWQ